MNEIIPDGYYLREKIPLDFIVSKNYSVEVGLYRNLDYPYVPQLRIIVTNLVFGWYKIIRGNLKDIYINVINDVLCYVVNQFSEDRCVCVAHLKNKSWRTIIKNPHGNIDVKINDKYYYSVVTKPDKKTNGRILAQGYAGPIDNRKTTTNNIYVVIWSI